MPVFDTSNITTTGLTVSGSTILSGNNASAILTVSGTAAALLTINDTPASATLATFSTNAGINILTITTGGTRINTFLIDSNNTTGTTGQFLSQTTNGSAWTGITSPKWYAENASAPATAPVATGTGSVAFGNGADANSPDMFVYGTNAGNIASNVSGSTFIGVSAGNLALNASGSTFIGPQAGNGATNAPSSVFIGTQAGYLASSATFSNFFGYQAGFQATNASGSTFIGASAGQGATNANNCFFVGANAGLNATNSNFSRFIGHAAGAFATNSDYALFFGYNAGSGQTNASKSILFGYQAGMAVPGQTLNFNSVIIGNNISLPSGSTNSFNFGGVLFGTNTFSGLTDQPSISGQSIGRVGINVIPSAISTTLHVSGTGLFNSTLNLALGTTTIPEVQFNTGSVLTTTAIAGAMEIDNSGVNYYSYDIGARGVNKVEQMVILTGVTPLISSNALPLRLFTGTTFPGGAFKVRANTAYMFESSFDLSGMSATLGTFSFGFSGTASIASMRYSAQTVKNVIASANNYTTFVTIRTSAVTVISSATTGTVGSALIAGVMRIGAVGGTVAPVTALSTAAAATVGQDSYFKVSPIGDTKVVNIGSWG